MAKNEGQNTKTRGVRLTVESLTLLNKMGINLSQLVQKAVDKVVKHRKCPVCGSTISKK